MRNTRRAVVLLAVLALTPTALAAAATPPKVVVPHFANCTAMDRKYPGGVERVGGHDKRPGGGHAKYRPYVSTAIYNANSKLDRDHDGVACER